MQDFHSRGSAAEFNSPTATILTYPVATGPSLLLLESASHPFGLATEAELQQLAESLPLPLQIASVSLAAAPLPEPPRRFSLVVIHAELDATGLLLSPYHKVAWAEFTEQWLAPCEPEYLLLLNCPVEHGLAVQTFFENLPSLQEVYAVLARSGKAPGELLRFLIPYLLNSTLAESDRAFARQVLALLLSSGAVIRWNWRDTLKQRLLNGFELLSLEEKQEVAAEILRRTSAAETALPQLNG